MTEFQPEVRTYKKKSLWSYVLKNGKRVYGNEHDTSVTYTCKLHHPDHNEMDQIIAKVNRGVLKKDICVQHHIKTNERLNRLIKKHLDTKQTVT